MVTPAQLDPSGTGPLQRAFIKDLTNRFARLKRALLRLIVDEDAFGIGDGKPLPVGPTQNTRWKFATGPEKMKQFEKWLDDQVKSGILSEDGSGNGDVTGARYIRSTYKQALVSTYRKVNKDKLKDSAGDFYEGTQNAFLKDTFESSEAASKMAMLGTRVYSSLKDVTSTMDAKMSRILAQGLADGKSPRDLGRQLAAEVDGISKSRGAMIARTEIIHSHAEGQLDAFEALKVHDLTVLAEWLVTPDKRLCSKCAELQGIVLTVAEARGLLPRHPNCRCTWVPADVGESKKGQVRSKSGIAGAIERSVKEERPNADTKDAFKLSKWLGADVKIDTRPKSVDSLPMFAPAEGLWGQQPTAVMRWMGKEGWNAKDAQRVLKEMGVDAAEGTIKTQLGAGVKGLRGPAASLTDEQAAILRAKRAGDGVIKPPPIKPPIAPPPVTPPPPIPPAIPDRNASGHEVRPWDFTPVPAIANDPNGATVRQQIVAEAFDKFENWGNTNFNTPARSMTDTLTTIRGTVNVDSFTNRDFELRYIKVNQVRVNQWGDGYLNESSKAEAAQFLKLQKAGVVGEAGTEAAIDSLGRLADHKPIIVDEFGGLIDGNHRHAAHRMLGNDHILALVPTEGKGTGKIVNLKEFFDDAKNKVAPKITDLKKPPGARVPTIDPVIKPPKLPPIAPPVLPPPVVTPPAIVPPTIPGDLPPIPKIVQPGTAVARWLGKEGFSFQDAKKVLAELDIKISDATLKTQLGAGAKGLRGAVAALTDAQAAALRARRVLPPPGLKPPRIVKPKVTAIKVAPPAPPVAPPVPAKAATNEVRIKLSANNIRQRIADNKELDDLTKKVTALAGDPADVDKIESLRAELAAHRTTEPRNWVRINEIYAEIAPIQERLSKVADQARLEAHKLLALPKEQRMEIQMGVARGCGPKVKERGKEARDFLQSVTSKRDEHKVKHADHSTFTELSPKKHKLEVELHQKAGRAYHNNGKVVLAPTSPAKTHAHEIGHAIEQQTPRMVEDAISFRTARIWEAATETVKMKKQFPGHGYGAEETGNKDSFDRYFGKDSGAFYCGKEYGFRATEIISMGVEALFDDPIKFAQKDPEYFKFIVGILRGSL